MSSAVEQLYQLVNLAESKIHLDDFLENLSVIIKKALHSEVGIIALYDESTKELYYFFGSSDEKSEGKNKFEDFTRISDSDDLLNKSANKCLTLNLTAEKITKRQKEYIKRRFGITPESILLSPMISRGKIIGVIEVINHAPKSFYSKYDEKIIKIIAGYSASVIDNSKLFLKNISHKRLSDLGQSIVNSAHGLKNILNNLDGATYIVEMGTVKKNITDVNKGWDILKRNSERLRDLVLDILLYSRPKKPEYKLSDINRVCADVKELIEKNAGEKNVRINLDLCSKQSDYCMDPKSIYRCILNLVSNAVYACEQKGGGEVTIKTQFSDAGELMIIVSDTGTGISKENLEHIFDVFFTTKGSKGTGLGLPVTKKIITEHLGTISVDSKEGTGTSFTIILPKYDCSKKE